MGSFPKRCKEMQDLLFCDYIFRLQKSTEFFFPKVWNLILAHISYRVALRSLLLVNSRFLQLVKEFYPTKSVDLASLQFDIPAVDIPTQWKVEAICFYGKDLIALCSQAWRPNAFCVKLFSEKNCSVLKYEKEFTLSAPPFEAYYLDQLAMFCSGKVLALGSPFHVFSFPSMKFLFTDGGKPRTASPFVSLSDTIVLIMYRIVNGKR